MARVQMNVRLEPDLVKTIDVRRKALGMSRDQWVSAALTHAVTLPNSRLPQPEQEQ